MKQWIAVSLLSMLLLSSAVWSAERVALVIGNGAYQEATLRNPMNDAADVAGRLESLGFSVTHATDLDHTTMKQQVEGFLAKLRPGVIALFYYSGHGVEVGGRNYLLPVDNASLGSITEVADRSLDVRNLVDAMHAAGPMLSLIVLDACRNNPWSSTVRAGSRGLAPMDAQRGTLIAYATRAGATAADGDGRNSPYTRALLKMLAVPDLEVTQLFNRVGLEVSEETHGSQIPWFSSSPVPSISLAASKNAEPKAATHGSLRVVVSPSNAEVHLDGQLIGIGSRTINALPPNSIHRVELRKAGHEGRVVVAYIKSGAETTVDVQLAPTGASTKTGDKQPVVLMGETSIGGFQDPLKGGGRGPEMVVLRGGTYRRGSEHGERDELPVRVVSIDTFAIGKYEITVAEFRQYAQSRGLPENSDDDQRRRVAHFVVNSPTDDLDELRQTRACYAYDEQQGDWWWQVGLSWHTPGHEQDERFPVVCINRDDALNYATWLSEQTGRKYRLPSEAELEFAIRSGSTTALPWDPIEACKYANIADQRKFGEFSWGSGAVSCSDGSFYPRDVGSYLPNAYGLFDTIGNVWEWTEDCYTESYQEAPVNGKPFVQRDCNRGVVRGGGFDSGPNQVRPANRRFVYNNNGGRAQNVGFRIAAEIQP
jgi:formylglycine-generating enzyme required for sulfatase activity